MNILVAASEMAPLAKTGGLGDVIGALPRALARGGHSVRVCLPRYSTLNLEGRRPRLLNVDLSVPIGDKKVKVEAALLKDKQTGLEICLISGGDYFDRTSLYVDPATQTDYEDNDERFYFFSRAVLAVSRATGFVPDIVHAHDWQTALLPVLLNHEETNEGFDNAKCILTIHNLAHQGQFPAERYSLLGLPDEYLEPGREFEFYEKVNFLKAGICFADAITTVSPRYAEEIQTGKFGCGLDGVLKQRSAVIHGILNGVDYSTWSPSRDKHIPYRYHVNNLGGKRMTRVELLNYAGLPVREKSPLIGIIARLVHQKGMELIQEAADRLLSMNIQMIVVGTGDPQYHKLFELLESRYPDKVRAYFRYDETLAHHIEGGADMFLMPSLFEPCGLNQMYSLKYGTIPIVHKVGGLADTIIDYNEQTGEGTGFVFDEESPEAMLVAVERAVALFGRKRLWTKLVKNAMRQDFSWGRAVAQYLSLFDKVRNN